MNGVNLRRFDFDYDVTWNGFFLDESLNVYSRYGGRDEGEPERRLHKDALLTTMRSVLAAHAEKKANPHAAAKLFQPVPKEQFTPEEIPLLKQSHQGCVHCHQVKEYQLLQWGHDGVFDQRKLFGWPLPENLGLEIDFRHGRRVRAVANDSFAAQAGVQADDLIVDVDGVPVRSEYDIRWRLHHAEDGKPIFVTVERPRAAAGDDPAKPVERRMLELRPTGSWRQTELGWRKSMRSVPVEFGFRGYALSKSQREEWKIDEGAMAVRIISVRSKGLAKNLGLQKTDLVIAHGDDRRNRSIEEFWSDLLRRHAPGEMVTLTVLREGAATTLKGKFPPYHTDETSVP